MSSFSKINKHQIHFLKKLQLQQKSLILNIRAGARPRHAQGLIEFNGPSQKHLTVTFIEFPSSSPLSPRRAFAFLYLYTPYAPSPHNKANLCCITLQRCMGSASVTGAVYVTGFSQSSNSDSGSGTYGCCCVRLTQQHRHNIKASKIQKHA